MAMPLDAQFVDAPIFNQLVPGEGPKSIRAVLDFTSVDEWTIDLTTAMNMNIIKAVQTIYFDLTDCNFEVVLMTEKAQQRIVLPRKSWGYVPILLPNPGVFTAKGPLNSGKAILHMLNVPMPIFVQSFPD